MPATDTPLCRWDRRMLLGSLLGLAMSARARAQSARPAEAAYRPLREPVPVIPPSELWDASPFRCWLVPRADDGVALPEVLLDGLLVRIPGRNSQTSELHAFCTLCPHEICQIDYPADADVVVMDSGPAPDNPLFFCGCHFSVFDPLKGGEPISGPAERAMFMFRFEIRAESVYITEIEDGAIKLLGDFL